MRKIAIALISVICAVLMCLGVSACGSDAEKEEETFSSSMAGKVYVFYTIKVSSDAENLETVEYLYKDKEISFAEDKYTCNYMGTTYFYAKKGSNIYLFLTEEEIEDIVKENAIKTLKLSGRTITVEEEFLGKKMIMTFKLQTEEAEEE